MSDFKPYQRTQITNMRPFIPGESLDPSVSISDVDRQAGSPQAGDMIARNPNNYSNQWLVAHAYFIANFKPI